MTWMAQLVLENDRYSGAPGESSGESPVAVGVDADIPAPDAVHEVFRLDAGLAVIDCVRRDVRHDEDLAHEGVIALFRQPLAEGEHLELGEQGAEGRDGGELALFPLDDGDALALVLLDAQKDGCFLLQDLEPGSARYVEVGLLGKAEIEAVMESARAGLARAFLLEGGFADQAGEGQEEHQFSHVC